ncbi:MAG: ATPase, T2SS/T4P/T4SS family, partial [Acidobacteriota bacterium]
MAEALDAAVARLCRYLGDGVVGALADPRTVEVYVNEDGDVRVAAEGKRRSTGERLAPEQVRSFLRAAANWGGRHLEGAASLDVELPQGQPFDGARLHGEMPPTVRMPVFSIRVLPRRIYRLREYVDAGALGISGLTVLSTALTERWNVLVGGSTGSGKTTFLNAMLAELAERCPGDRLILLDGWSKTYAMTGWRLGWSLWPPALYDKARKLAVNVWSCVNAPTQFAGLAALTGPQD